MYLEVDRIVDSGPLFSTIVRYIAQKLSGGKYAGARSKVNEIEFSLELDHGFFFKGIK